MVRAQPAAPLRAVDVYREVIATVRDIYGADQATNAPPPLQTLVRRELVSGLPVTNRAHMPSVVFDDSG